MAVITVTGTLWHPVNSCPWAFQRFKIRFLTGWAADTNHIYPVGGFEPVTDINGQFSIELAVPLTGAWLYEIQLPDSKRCAFYASVNGPFDLNTIVSNCSSDQHTIANNWFNIFLPVTATLLSVAGGYTLKDADAGSVIRFTADGVLNLPDDIPIATQVIVLSGNSSVTLIAEGTLNGLGALLNPQQIAYLVKTGATVWDAYGEF